MSSKQNDSFSKAYKILNPQQKKAVDTIEGPVMVIAGPGTGKTQVLILRIANILLKTDVNPENILALTFTESAVAEMRKRLVNFIGTAGYRVEISTFHGFCNNIIKNNSEDFESLLSSESITEVEQIQILEEIISKLSLEHLKPFGDPMFYLKPLLSAINDLKKEGVSVAELKQALEKQQAEFEQIEDLYHEKGAHGPKVHDDGTVIKGTMKGKYQEIQKQMLKNQEVMIVYAEYQKRLREKRVYDFNDMLLEVVTKLKKDPYLLLKLQEVYQYILIDEHQDTNSAQNKLVELLCNFYENPNLFVVGDEKQAIFRFQGASLENFLYFKKLYPEAVVINLQENYRSTQSILDAAHSMIQQNLLSELLNKEANLTAKAGHIEKKIQIAALSDYFGEYHFVAQNIKEKINFGVSPKEIAVICRNNRDLQPMVDVLEQYGIPFNLESDQNIFNDADIRKLILIFRAVANFGSDPYLIPVLHIDFFKIDQLDIYKLMNFASISRISIYDVLIDPENLQKSKLAHPEKVLALLEQLKKWKEISVNDNIEVVFSEIVNNSGMKEYILSKPNALEILDKVSGLFEDIKMQVGKNPLFGLEDFLGYLDLLQSHDILVKKPVKTTLKEAVRLMTAHKSKGLEFEEVFIINAFDGHWGNLKKRAQYIKLPWAYLGIKLNLSLEENEDERRLFYVALTRAKKNILITYSTKSLDSKEQIPSQFLDEIDADLKDLVDTANFEKMFLENKQLIFAPKINIRPDIKNQEFFKELFLQKGLSVTALNNYLVCPWKFFYRNLLRFPEAKTPSLIFGTAVHQSLNAYIKALKIQKPDISFLLAAFEKALEKEMAPTQEFTKYKQKGETVLQAYFDQYASKWGSNLTSELRVKGVKLSDNVVLNGMIDMIEPTKKTDEVIVYDFKTGAPKSRSKIMGNIDAMGDYKRQLIFYKILLDNYYRGKMNMVEGVIDFVEPDKKGKFKRESFVIDVSEVKLLQEMILQISEQIVNLKFWDQRCDDKSCEYCKLREVMGNPDYKFAKS